MYVEKGNSGAELKTVESARRLDYMGDDSVRFSKWLYTTPGPHHFPGAVCATACILIHFLVPKIRIFFSFSFLGKSARM